MTTQHRRQQRRRNLFAVALGGLLALGLLSPGSGRTRAHAADPIALDTVTLTAPGATTTTPGVDVTLGSFTVAGSEDLSLTLTVLPTGSGALTLGCAGSCTNVTYEAGDGVADSTITLGGTAANVTTALASVTLVAPAAGEVSVVVTVDDHAGTTPGPNGHQYRHYPTATTWSAARAAAGSFTLYGKTGYLVTVTSAEEEAYLETLVGAASVHLGLTGKSARGRNAWTWSYAGGPDAGTTPAFFDWLPKEPRTPKQGADDYGKVRLRTTGGKTAWDVSIDDSACCGYVVEFGDAEPPRAHASVNVWVGEGPPPTTTTTTIPATTRPPVQTTTIPDTSIPDTSIPDTTVPDTTPPTKPAPRPTTTTVPPTTTTSPVPEGWKADIKVDALIGDPSVGAEVTVRGKGLEPGRRVEAGVHSTYRVFATGTVESDGSFELVGRLPADLEPGTHTIEVHYAGEPEVLDSAVFEVDTAGSLADGEDRLGFGAYDPGAHTGVVIGAAVAALTVAGAAGAAGGGGGGGGGQDAGAVGEIDVEEALDGEFEGRGFGDRKLAFAAPGTGLVDRLASAAPTRIGGAVPGVARAIVGSSYLRAMFGSLAVLVPAAGLVLGVVAAASAGFEALPPSTALLAVILVLSALDGVAGLMAATGFGVSLLVTGAIDSLNSLLVVAGLIVVMTGVSLLAEMVRPLSRPPGKGFSAVWTRAGDAVVGALFVGWVIKSLVEALEGLRGHSLDIAADSGLLAILCMIGIVTRVALETVAAHHYPARLRAARPHDEVPDYSTTRRWVLVFARTGALMLAAQPFVGWNWYLFGGCLSYAFEQYLDIVQDRLPVFKRLAPIVPLRVFKFITSLIICTLLAKALEQWVSGTDLVRVAFLVLNIPMTATETFIALGREGDRGPVTWWRRVGAIGMVTVGALIVTGHLF